MKPLSQAVSLLLLSASTIASASTLTGTVNNGTTGKPAAGDEVVLIKLGQGMEEAGHTKADNNGKFSFDLKDDNGPHLVRAIHQGVTYHRMAPPGTTSVQVDVYNVGKKIDGISVTADVMRFQAQGNELQGARLFAVENKSKPPRTQMNDQNFEFFLPEGAEIDQGMAMTAGGQPINSAPVPQHEKNRYAFVFPLRPGTTRFQLNYHLAYNGKLAVDPKAIYGSQHFVVMLPKSMQFAPSAGTLFQSMDDPQQSDAAVQVASNTQVGDSLAFTISGNGVLSEDDKGQQTAAGNTAAPGRDNRPGGGIGAPIDAPDPLEKYRWWILGGFAIVLAGGAIFIAKRQSGVASAALSKSPEEPVRPVQVAPTQTRNAGDSRKPSMLLEALKEELFQLELDHKQGNISQSEYEKAKAALDQTLERALKRTATVS